MFHRFSAFVVTAAASALLLAGCATLVEDSSQEVEFRIVGADTALCHLKNTDYNYKVHAPGTVRIQKTHKDLNLRCVATGNRERIATISSSTTDMLAANISNGVFPGVAWDIVSGAANAFPDVITVDFTGVPAQPMPLPEYQRVLNQNPHLVGLEEFRPGRSALISDYSTPVPTLSPREDAFAAPDVATDRYVAPPAATNWNDAYDGGAVLPSRGGHGGGGDVMLDSDPEMK